MGRKCDQNNQNGYLSGLTPFLSCIIFGIVGSSLMLIHAFGYVGCVALGEAFGPKAQLATFCYHTRQIITLFAVLGTVLALISGLCGRMSCLWQQWLISIFYFVVAGYIIANQLVLHSKLVVLMRFAAVIAGLSGMAQTSAIYCMTDCAMPGESFYSISRITSFFVGCTFAGPMVTLWILAKRYFESDVVIGSYGRIAQTCDTLTLMACLAGVWSAIAASVTSYLYFSIDTVFAIESAPWFPLFVKSPCQLTRETLKKHLKTLYMPLLWTVNPLFVALAIGVTLNSTTSLKLIFWQYVIYVIFAGISVTLGYLVYGAPDCENEQGFKQKVLKTNELTWLLPDEEDPYSKKCRNLMFPGAQLRSKAHKPMNRCSFPRVGRNTQWRQLKGDLWSEWQKHDATYLLCQEPVHSIYDTLDTLFCLEITDFYDNVGPIMHQYRALVNCTGLLHEYPFTIDPTWTPLQQLHQMLIHQRMVLMAQFERTGKMYTEELRSRLSTTSCGFLEQLTTLTFCCLSGVEGIRNTDYLNVTSKKEPSKDCPDLSKFAKKIPHCICCGIDGKNTIHQYLASSIESSAQLCEKMIEDMHADVYLQDTPGNPDYGKIDDEKRIVCVLRDYCESNLLIIISLLFVEEYLLLYEWLCKLSWYVRDMERRLSQRTKCTEHCEDKCSDSNKDCIWDQLRRTIPDICRMLLKMHDSKIQLLLQVKSESICCYGPARPDLLKDELEPCVLLAVTRLMVIIVLALVYLLDLEECIEGKKVLQKQNVHYDGMIYPVKPPQCKDEAYDLKLSAMNYILHVLSQLDTFDAESITNILDNVVVWYAGFCNNIWQLCPEIAFEERYNYATDIYQDEEIRVPVPTADVVALMHGNRGIQSLYDNMGKFSDTMTNLEKRERSCGEIWDSTNCYKDSDKSDCECDEEGTDEKDRCLCSNDFGVVSEDIKSCNENICDNVKALVTSITTALSCTTEAMDCQDALCKSISNVDLNSLEILCPDDKGDQDDSKTDKCSEEDTKPEKCDENESEVSRFGYLVLTCLKLIDYWNFECCCTEHEKWNCGCTAYAKCLLQCEPKSFIVKLLRYCFGCSNCCEVKNNVLCTKIPCFSLLFLYNLHDQLGTKKKLPNCRRCPDKKINTEILPPCTSECTPCMHLQYLGGGLVGMCCCASRWRRLLRCYVYCEENCQACTKSKKGKVPNECKSEHCQNNQQSEGLPTHGCDLMRLCSSLFHCEGCSKPSQEAATEETQPAKLHCVCIDTAPWSYGSKAAIIGDKPCEHRLGCALSILNQDLSAFKHNACVFNTQINCLVKQAKDISNNIDNVNEALGCLSSLLCYAHCGVEKRRAQLKELSRVPDAIGERFPCYAETIKDICYKDVSVVTMIRRLLFACYARIQHQILFIYDIDRTLMSIFAQCYRLFTINKNISIINEIMSKNWVLLLNFKGSQTEGYTENDLSSGEGSCYAGVKEMVNTSDCSNTAIDAHIDVGVESKTSFVCFKYIWVFICFTALIKFFNWFGVENTVSESKTMLTSITVLSAAQLASAVKANAYNATAPKGTGCSTGTKVNLVMLMGMLTILLLSWISNIINGYWQISTSMTYITQKMRLIGFFDTVKPPTTHLIMRSLSDTTKTDAKGLLKFWGIKKMPEVLNSSTMAQVFGTILFVSGINPFRFTEQPSRSRTLHEFMAKQMGRSVKSVEAVLDLVSFLQMCPDAVQMLNKSSSKNKGTEVDLEMLLGAWESETHLIDETMRSVAIHQDVLKELKRDMVRMVNKMPNHHFASQVYELWNVYYNGQLSTMGFKVIANKSRLQILTRKQFDLEKYYIAQQYVADWDMFCTWLTKCSIYANGLMKYDKQGSTSTEDKERASLVNEGISAPQYNLSQEQDSDHEGSVLRKFVESTDFASFNVCDAYSPEGDFEDIDAGEEHKDVDKEKQSKIKVSPRFLFSYDFWNWFKHFDAFNPTGDFKYIDDVVEHRSVKIDPVESKGQESLLGSVSSKHKVSGPHPLDWFMANEANTQCLKLFRNSGTYIMEHEDGYSETRALEYGRVFEKIDKEHVLLTRADAWKNNKLEFCTYMDSEEATCKEAVMSAYNKAVEFANRQHNTEYNLLVLFFKFVFPSYAGFDAVNTKLKNKEDTKDPLDTISLYKALHIVPNANSDVNETADDTSIMRTDLVNPSEEICEGTPQKNLRLIGHWCVFNPAPITQSCVQHVLM
ncbi:putative integral membrane protein [Babesia bovis T2Bo]|uniref:Uncharacterized protein n=1 Tax=Babesia bovis TaxID=5865 RepID=A7ANH9_BABBO|nr:putative integral membrane protein [Babesia bovis T2Bo]EDO08113.1 putative integral membrane protein [Babesia bovis T2Bo]|eukprot:XP_001611681.1 hypothetical protein [Babesia bovis T2Bo]